jgi:uncharacterized membrane protein
MILAHVVNPLLALEYRSETIFYIVNVIEGLVAPAFLFAAGGSFSIIISKKREDILFFRKPAIRYFLRVVQILMLAYLLHIPYRTLHQCKTIMTGNEYLFFINCDILQSIGIGLLFLLVLYILLRNDKIFYVVLLLLSLIIIISTPYVWRYDFAKILPVEFATLLNRKYGSLFPLFPWVAYVFLGCLVSNMLLKNLRSNNEEGILKKFSIAGIIIIFLGIILEFLSIPTTEFYDFWYTSPNIFMIRIGAVLIFIYILWFLEVKFKYKMKIFGVFGRESLLVYIIHLIIIYGSALGLGLYQYIGTKLNWLEVMIIFIGICILMVILAAIWHFIKDRLILFERIILLSVWGYFFYYFITKPF